MTARKTKVRSAKKPGRKKASGAAKPLTGKSLVIVESPAKAKTINKILGEEYLVKPCYGHIRDLPHNRFGIDIANNFTPTYRIIKKQTQNIQELKKVADRARAVYIASDPDREGEAIAWHLIEALGLTDDRTWRVSFDEITAEAVRSAFQSPAKIDMAKVNAQQARRFLDRIVGYKLSPLLWKKIARGLSAGRVQSVALKLVVEREKEIKNFVPTEYWKITASLSHGQTVFEAALVKLDDSAVGSPADADNAWIGSEPEAKKLAAELGKSDFRVARITEKENSQSPPPPFITSTLQQQAVIQLGYSTKKTMFVAQQLYEGVDLPEGPTGLITYMRTDSVRVNQDAISHCRDFIGAHYGNEYLNSEVRYYKSRKSAQEAHEAIRPSYVDKTPESLQAYLTADQYKLYRLIWNRFVATQMSAARWKNTSIQIEAILPSVLEMEISTRDKGKEKISVRKAVFGVSGRQLLFKGYLALANPSEQFLPALKEGEQTALKGISSQQAFTQPPPRYNEASLVKTLEKYGIGRPSTYVPIIYTIIARGYVKKIARQLEATELGILVSDKLQPYFENIFNTSFTAEMEEELDKIEEKQMEWLDALKNFYGPFSQDLDKATAEMTLEKGRESPNGEKCPKCGKAMVERWSRFGKFLACIDYPNCKTIISLKPPTLAEPTNEVCEKCGKPMVIKRGRRGRKFIACSGYPDCKNAKPLNLAKEDETPLPVIENTENNDTESI